MAKQPAEGLMYKDHPLRRVGSMIYYGSMADPYIILMQVKETKKEKDLEMALRRYGYLRDLAEQSFERKTVKTTFYER